jgi:hypothetical protein
MNDFTCKRSLQNSERFPVKSAPKKKKPTFTSALATWASELFSIYALVQKLVGPELWSVQHAALHVHAQQTIWQQVLIED